MFARQIAALAPLLVGAFAVQSVHLVNCGTRDSVVVFCSDDSNCDFNPAPNNFCVPDDNGLQTWEGSAQSCDFPTGVIFTWDIVSTAQSQNLYTHVGTGSNGFTTFNIFKDDQHTMYIDSFSDDCRSIYYSLPE